jgi:cardiolipin synthase
MTPTTQTTWKFMLSTQDAWSEMLEEIKNAKTSIDFEQFNFYPDNIGRQFITALTERVQAGVKVRLLIDAMGSVGMNQSLYPEVMEHVGIQLRYFNWLLPFSTGNKRTWYFRDHKRTLIIDGKKIFTGGVCIGDFARNWRDTTVVLSGEIVRQAEQSFDQSWKKAHKRTMLMGRKSKSNLDGFSFLTQAPLLRQRYVYYKLIESIKKAEKYIYLTTPYFLPDHRLLRTLISARRRGVDVKILVPEYSDHPIVDRGSHTFFHKVLAADIQIYRYKTMIHSKTAVIDDDWAMVGTLNLDSISLRYNFESAVVATNNKFSKEILTQFDNDIAEDKATELTLHAWNKRPFFHKFLEFFVYPLRFFL